MKFLRILGWICIPFIMVIISWRKLGKAPKVAAIIWSILIILFFLIPTEDQEKQLAETKTVPTTTNTQTKSEEVNKPSVEPAPKDEIEAEPSGTEVEEETKTIDWRTKIKEIANSDQSVTEKFDQVELELVNNYIPSEEELTAFENEIISAFKNKEYLKDITDAEYMLTNIFKSSVIVSSYEDKNEPMPSFAFDFWQNSKYTYRGADAVDSESVKANEDQMERALEEI
ncbi:hypothetical protein [Paenibacillus sp. An7]|uniref:hypothetical protein n=1 Tax=Paenibacillus sp. An7 TaxID=2689577 RepID=UPI001359A9AE|nr:hypothetical protein [Paenibacillus sp. An7]